MTEQRKAPKWENDDGWVLQKPDPKKIQCSSCYWVEADEVFPDGEVRLGCMSFNCQAYSESQHKPVEVLFDGAKCDYYLSKAEMEDE